MSNVSLCIGLLVLCSACGQGKTDREHAQPNAGKAQSTVGAPANANREARVFTASGIVETVTPNRKHIVVEHGEIPGFMAAMTMPFALSDTAVATGVVPQDSIRFQIAVLGSEITISEIQIIQ